MATDVILTLDELRCIRESDRSGGGSEPYIWPALIWIDDDTLNTGPLVGSAIGSLDSAQRIIRDSMRAGQTATIPNGTLRFRRDESATFRGLIVVVAMWEQDDMPLHAVRAGFSAFKRELPAAIASRLFDLQAADDAGRAQLTAAIARELEAKIRSAITDDLTLGEKAQIAIGTLDPDDFVGNSFAFFADPASRPLEFRIRPGASEEYVIAGRIDVRRVVPDRCRPQAQAVAAAQQAVDNIDAEIAGLQAELNGDASNGPPRPKPVITREIARLRREELAPAVRALETAQDNLRECRLGGPVIGPTEGIAVVS